jgi:hypothetical protein
MHAPPAFRNRSHKVCRVNRVCREEEGDVAAKGTNKNEELELKDEAWARIAKRLIANLFYTNIRNFFVFCKVPIKVNFKIGVCNSESANIFIHMAKAGRKFSKLANCGKIPAIKIVPSCNFALSNEFL